MENYFVGRYRGPFGAGFFLLLCFGVKVMLVFYLGPVEGIFHLCRHFGFTCAMVPLSLPSCNIISLSHKSRLASHLCLALFPFL